MLSLFSLSVSSKMAILTKRLEIRVILCLALVDGMSYAGFTAPSVKVNPTLPLLP
jgi:hypothetical protein